MEKYLNNDFLQVVKYFLNKINERSHFLLGYNENYDNEGDPALDINVEYFHPHILFDDRMKYIMENIVTADISDYNIVCNTIISHFYGARGIHQVLTRDSNPKTALVDFERLLIDIDYENEIRDNLKDAIKLKIPIYGSTELRTSLFDAANSYVSELKSKPKNNDPINILLWVSSFIIKGTIDKILNANSLKELFNILVKINGIGNYYGYHCSTSNSVNPKINANHDERFCVPGPGATKTVNLLFNKDCTYKPSERVIWFRENYKELIGEIPLHEDTWNIIVNGKKILKEDQNELKTYGCEVGLCQCGIYDRLSNNHSLIKRRKVARLDESLNDKFFKKNKIKKLF